MNILVTGATGFIGSQLLSFLIKQLPKHKLSVVVRKGNNTPIPKEVSNCFFKEIHPNTNWQELSLRNIEIVIHLAAHIQVTSNTMMNPLKELRKTNSTGTINLAQQSATNGVRRFIFLSSIKVNGECSNDQPFTPQIHKIPTDPYALSKYEAEKSLLEISQKSDMEVVIIRPPLVYGPNVKGNFHTLMHWMNKGIPLPLGAINNKRSFVAIENLIDLIVHCIDHTSAANQVLLVSDNRDISTTELLRRLSQNLNKRTLLLPIPSYALYGTLKVVGKHSLAQRLCGNLQVDITQTIQRLNWQPPLRFEEALEKTTQSWLQANVNQTQRGSL